ncbi:hypothetical protein Syun_004059 [Stephania yunnanensis]|uniref:Alliinase C-terminal domain-containing protein n=1 Tax=Stephania yunnanensis TaxID=152371 RepID=A0AAP0L3U2_9MAGN
MAKMVNTGVYRGDNGFKPGYVTHLEGALKISCPTSMIKAIPHIESRIKTSKRDWFIVNDMIHGVKHSSIGFGFNNTSNMVVTKDEVWDDYIASFIHYVKCCLVFGNDCAIEEDAFDAMDTVEELGSDNESNSENGSDLVVSEDVEVTQKTSQSQSVTLEVTSTLNKRKKRTSDGGLAEYMISAAQILGSKLLKASNDISAAINAKRDMRHLVVATMEEVLKISEVDKTMYNAKIMGRPELMQAFLSCKDSFRLAWLQRMWAFVKDEAAYRRMSSYMSINSMGASRDAQLRAFMLLRMVVKDKAKGRFEFGYKTMRERWEMLNKNLSKSKHFSLQKLEHRYCSFFKEVIEGTDQTKRRLVTTSEPVEDCYDILFSTHCAARNSMQIVKHLITSLGFGFSKYSFSSNDNGDYSLSSTIICLGSQMLTQLCMLLGGQSIVIWNDSNRVIVLLDK